MAISTRSLKVSNTSFDDPANAFAGEAVEVQSCGENPCGPGGSCSFHAHSTFCDPCAANEKGSNGISCVACSAGKQPTPDGAACSDCTGSRYSTIGICEDCPSDSVANADHAGCSKCPVNEVADVVQPERTAARGRRLRLGGSSTTGTSGSSTSTGGTNTSISMSGGDRSSSDSVTTSMGGAGANTTLGLCTCAKGYFNVSRGTRCHSGDYSATVPVATSLGCEACDNLECATECHGELLIIAAGWTLETQVDDSISIFQCQYAGACPGGTVLRNDSTCSEGYSGRLCGACDKNYTLASDGECTPCGTGTWLGIALAIVGVVVLAAAATKVRLLFNYFTLLRGAAGLISDLQVKPIVKIIVALGQIVGGLDGVLNVSMPAIFRNFMASFMSIFKFDITLAIGLGCFSDGDYLTSLFVNFAMVIVVALLVGAIYAFQMIQLIRNPPRNDSPKGKERLQKLFAWFDKDGDGIDFAEVQKFVEKIDPSVSKAEAMALFRRADADESGIIDYQEFSDVMNGTPLDLGKLVKSNAVSNADHVRKLFQQFDDDGDGKIDLEEIRSNCRGDRPVH